MRASINGQGESALRVAIQRTARESRQEAYEIGKAVALDLASVGCTWTIEGPSRTPRPPRNAPADYAPRGLMRLVLPTRDSIDLQTRSLTKECTVVEPAERQRLVQIIEDVLSQYVLQVDTLPTLRWVLRPRFGEPCPAGIRFGASDEDREAYDQIKEEHEAWRLELLEPFIAGKYPVKHNDVFSEFHTKLTAIERAAVASAAWGATNAQYVSFSIAAHGLDVPEMRQHWRPLASSLLARDWVVETPRPQHLDSSLAPFVGRGRKSGLLPIDQMRCS